MAGGGGAPTQQNVKTETSNLPEYARPYFQNLMGRAEQNLNTQYTPYGYTQNQSGQVVRAIDPATGQPVNAQRLAGFTPAQEQIQQNILGMQAPNQFATGSALAFQAGRQALDQQFNPSQFTAQQVNMGPLQQYGMQAPQLFGTEQAQQYMSPFFQQALEPQLRSAVSDARRAQITQDLGAARQGTYGGSRQLLASLEREKNLGQQMGDIRARGLQSAFESAQQQFERDRAAQMGAGRENLQSLLQTQQLGTQSGLQAALANQQQALEAQRLGEQSRQFGASQGLAGLQAAGQMGQTLGNLGQYQQQANLQRLQAQSAAATEQRGFQQQLLDQAYADFLRQRDYPMEVLGQYSNLLRGIPIGLNTTQTTYAPPPSMASQVLGTGLGALGMARTLGG
jgi:hypothetical protein